MTNGTRTNDRQRRTQQERRDESSRRLLEAAIELIAERGYEATSAGAIAERAGYSRSLVNVRYGSKAALLRVILETELEDRLLEPSAVPLDGLGQILDRIDRTVRLAAEDPRLLRAFFVVLFEAVGPVVALRPHVVGWLARLERATVVSLRAGQSDGSIRDSVDEVGELQEFAHLSIGLAYRWVLEGERYDLAGELGAWRERTRVRLAVAT